MKTKRLVAFILSIAMVMSCLVGCGSTSSDTQATDGDQIVLRYATQHPTGNPANDAAENIAAKVLERTEGRIKIDVYPSGQLGDYTQIYDELSLGTIDIAHISVPETYDFRAAASMLPFLLKNYEEAKIVYAPDSWLSQQMREIQANVNIHFFGFWLEGFGGIATTKEMKNATDPTADKGVLIRIAPVDVFRVPMDYRGFNTSTIPYSDVFVSMQTGVVDGWAGGTPNSNYLSFRDVIKYVYQDNDFCEATQILMSNTVYQKLSEEDQKILTEVFEEELATCFDIAEAEDAKYLDMMEEQGIQVIRFTDEEIDAVATAVRNDVWPQFNDLYGEEFMSGLLASLPS